MIYRRQQTAQRRRAVILLVVLALLTLFAIVGLAFVYYAQSQATSSRFWRESDWERFRTNAPPAPLPPDQVFKWGLKQLIYDVADNDEGAGSSMRGHSMVRNTYGFNDSTLNLQPYSGVGRWRQNFPARGINQADIINHTYFRELDGFVIDPERPFADTSTPRANPGAPRHSYTGGGSVSYTYPDAQSMFVAAVKADGTVMVPSFHRPWLFGDIGPAGHPTGSSPNPNWTNTTGKYLSLRPRPVDMGPGFPYPPESGGDVRNRTNGPPGNDSVWMDLNYPVNTYSDGRKFKPLFAMLVEPLDNRVDLNAHGNRMGPGGGHGSGQGWGKWEVNPGRVLQAGSAEWMNLMVGNTGVDPTWRGRYGPDGYPSATGNSTSGNRTPRFFAQVDFNGSDETATPPGASSPYVLPGETGHSGGSFPDYANAYGNATTIEGTNHASLYDYYNPEGWTYKKSPPPPNSSNQFTTQYDDLSHGLSELRKLVYAGAVDSEVAQSMLTKLCPQNFSDDDTVVPTASQLAENVRRRNLVTLLSADLGRPGLGPWLWDRTGQPVGVSPTSGYVVDTTKALGVPPGGPLVAMPDLGTQRATSPTPFGDFDATWRSTVAAMERVDLRRSLRSYPHRQRSGGGWELQHGMRFDDGGANQTAAQNALSDRQRLARDVYERLLVATGAVRPTNLASPANDQLEALRWLAQLAVNIVDYIDDDEISTPFNFYGYQGDPFGATVDVSTVTTNPNPAGAGENLPRYWVFGTELPAVVISEVHSEYRLPRDPMDKTKVVDGNYPVRTWVELHNPLRTSVPGSVQRQDQSAVPLHMAGGGMQPAYSPYRIVLANTKDDALLGPLHPNASRDNAVGAPDNPRGTADFTSATTRTVSNTDMTTAPMRISPQGYFLLGPQTDAMDPKVSKDAYDTLARNMANQNVPLYPVQGMEYSATCTAGPPISVTPDDRIDTMGKGGLLVALRRLANPHLPPNNTILAGGAINPLYNPYITVDYVEGVRLNEINDDPANPDPDPAKQDKYASIGKKQPYASHKSQRADQTSSTGGNADNIQHTLGLANAPLASPFDWLLHLDRPLTSSTELLNVSAGRPTDLLQRFIIGNNATDKHRHRAPWFDEDISDPNNQTTMPNGSHRLWRFFELAEAGDMASGISPRGRIPGKININMVWDIETFLALCDPQGGNRFTLAQVQTMWNNLVASRTPGLSATPSALSQNDRPFHSLGVGHRPNSDPQGGYDINNTLLRSIHNGTAHGNGTVQRLFEVPGAAHPALQYELLNKIFGNLTTRSNVFAVYMTVGFFEVTDDTKLPIKLGQEMLIGGQVVRHKMFCIVDRSQLTLDLVKSDGTPLTSFVSTPAIVEPPSATAVAPPASPGAVTQLDTPVWVSLATGATLTGTHTYQAVGPGGGGPINWQIQKGTLLVVDDDGMQETVEVLDVNTTSNSFQASFKRWHREGFRIRMPGNPGPQPNFDYNLPAYKPVVPLKPYQ